MYTKKMFGKELEKKINVNFDIRTISKWAYGEFLNNCSQLEGDLGSIIMDVFFMEEGPGFEYSKEELLALARNLQK